MNYRRLVGIDLGIASAHTVRVLDGTATTLAKRKAWPTVESLTEVEAAALAGAPAGTRLEVVMEPTGPAWLPIAVFFTARGHWCIGCPRPRRGPAPVLVAAHQDQRHRRRHPGPAAAVRPGRAAAAGAARRRAAALDRRVRAADRLTQAGAEHKVRIKDLVRQLLPMTPLTGDSASPTWPCWNAGPTRTRWSSWASKRLDGADRQGIEQPQGADRADAVARRRRGGGRALRRPPGVAFADLAAEVATEVRLLRAVQAELAAHAAERETAYRWVDPAGLARSPARPGRRRRPRPRRRHGRPGPLRHGQAVPVLHRARPQGLRDRRHRPQGPSHVQGRVVAAAHHPDPRRRHTPASKTPSWPGSTTCRWSNAARTTSARSAWSPPTWPSALWAVMNRSMPYVICDTDGRPVTPDRGQDDHRRALDRPRRGPRPPPQQEGGEGPSASPHGTVKPDAEAPTNEATFPTTHRHRATTATTSTDEPLDNRSPIGNQSR